MNFKKDQEKIYKEWHNKKHFVNKSWTEKYLSFDKLLNIHRKKSLSNLNNAGFNLDQDLLKCEFIYNKYNLEKVKVLEIQKHNKEYYIFLNKTVFFATSGGQSNDTGLIIFNNNRLKIHDVKKANGHIVHITYDKPLFQKGNIVNLEIDKNKRNNIMYNHSATHLLHAILRKKCHKMHIQKGSMIGDQKFRFDFYSSVLLDKKIINKCNKLVNKAIIDKIKCTRERCNIKDINSSDIEMNFQEKYNDFVNTISFGTLSKELCGGTHVKNSAEIQAFLIINCKKKSSDIYRIQAITTWHTIHKYLSSQYKELLNIYNNINKNNIDDKNKNTYEKINLIIKKLNKYCNLSYLKKQYSEFLKWNESYDFEDCRKLISKVTKYNIKQKINPIIIKKLIDKGKQHNNDNIITSEVSSHNFKDIDLISDTILKEVKNTLVILFTQSNDKYLYLCASNIKNNDIDCSLLMKKLGNKYKGSGGGKANFARGTLNTGLTYKEIIDAIY